MSDTKYEYTGVSMPHEIKTKIRIMAAERGISLAKMSLQLLELGLDGYQSGANLDLKAGQAKELIKSINGGQA